MPYLPILTYHRVVNEVPTKAVDPKRIAVSAAQFRSHLRMLQRLGYYSFPLNQYPALLREGKSVSPRSIAITFDDAYEEMVTLALPILKDTGFTATVFAVSGHLGKLISGMTGHANLLTDEGLRTWRRAGMEVGSHTSHHVHLPQVDEATAKREIGDDKKRLEEILGENVPTFAYPYGEADEKASRLVYEAGFEGAFVTDRGRRDHTDNLFRIRRVVIFPRTNRWDSFLEGTALVPRLSGLEKEIMKRSLSLWLPVLLWVYVIFHLSSIPYLRFVEGPWDFWYPQSGPYGRVWDFGPPPGSGDLGQHDHLVMEKDFCGDSRLLRPLCLQ